MFLLKSSKKQNLSPPGNRYGEVHALWPGYGYTESVYRDAQMVFHPPKGQKPLLYLLMALVEQKIM